MGYFSFIPRTYRIALGAALLIFAIACVVTPVFGSIVTEQGEFVIVPTLLVGVFGFFGFWLVIDGLFLAVPPEADLDFTDIPYADGTPVKKPEEPDVPEPEVQEVPLTIEEKLAVRKARLEKAKREGKI